MRILSAECEGHILFEYPINSPSLLEPFPFLGIILCLLLLTNQPHPALLQTQGGGNCANALTAAARLGLQPFLVSKIGDDGIGEQILSQLQGDGVQTTHVVRGENSPSPFTYIIVDRTGMSQG